MRVVGLVSGGKDSVYSLLECVRLGHTLVAIANLYPAPRPPDGAPADELDSFMFQTVGAEVVTGLADCLGVPLFRIATRGKAAQRAVAYVTPSDAANDEVEDLYRLLACVQARVPGVEAVSSGAILSNYQRVRVENVYVDSLLWCVDG